jgi:hypothetical protein
MRTSGLIAQIPFRIKMNGKEVKQTIMFFLTRIVKYIPALKRKTEKRSGNLNEAKKNVNAAQEELRN